MLEIGYPSNKTIKVYMFAISTASSKRAKIIPAPVHAISIVTPVNGKRTTTKRKVPSGSIGTKKKTPEISGKFSNYKKAYQ